jgi:ketosteroid isomerase-like protein
MKLAPNLANEARLVSPLYFQWKELITMSEYDNLNVVKDTYLAYREHNFPALRECLADDVRWFAIGPTDVIPTAGERYGPDQVEQYFATLEDAEGVGSFEPQEFIAERDKVVAIGDLRREIKSTGGTINSPWIHVFTLRRGKITEFRSFYDTAAAITALETKKARAASRGRSEDLRSSIL